MSTTSLPPQDAPTRGFFSRFRWIFTETGLVFFLLFVFLPFGAYLSTLEERANDAWIAEAAEVEQALNDFYVEDISYDRELVSQGRGLHDTEVAVVDGELRTDCVAVVWKDGDTVAAAGLQCSEPIAVTAEKSARVPAGEPEPARH
jgi:hypothetical protein